jgi:hypothetical protein
MLDADDAYEEQQNQRAAGPRQGQTFNDHRARPSFLRLWASSASVIVAPSPRRKDKSTGPIQLRGNIVKL